MKHPLAYRLSIINYCTSTNINLLYYFCINKINKTPLIKFRGTLSGLRLRTKIQVNLISRPRRERPVLLPADNKKKKKKEYPQKATRKRKPNLRSESTFKHILSTSVGFSVKIKQLTILSTQFTTSQRTNSSKSFSLPIFIFPSTRIPWG